MSSISIKEVFLVGGFVYASIAGAGFASGKEIWFYFAGFGWICYPLIIVAGILFFLLSFMCLQFGKKFGISSVSGMNNAVFGKFAFVAELMFIFCNLILLGSMLAGADSLFNMSSLTTFRLGGVVTCILAILVVWLGFNKLVKINCVIVPALLIVVLITFLYCTSSIPTLSIPVVSTPGNFWLSLLSSISFVTSNLYFSGFIFAKLGVNHSTKTNLLGCALGSIFMVITILGIVTTIYANPYASMSDMPIITIANNISTIFGVITEIVVWLGIFTTATTLMYTIANWFGEYFGNYHLICILIGIVALLFSGVGFSNIINFFYPILGLIGAIFVTFMSLKFYRSSKPNYNIRGNPKCHNLQ